MGDAKKKILVVDDQEPNRKLLRDLLSFKGYEIIEAGNGKDAVKKADSKPALILLDLNLPDISGIEVAQKLKGKNIPIIMITASEDSKPIQDAFAAGAVDYVLKPFQPADLAQKITKVLG